VGITPRRSSARRFSRRRQQQVGGNAEARAQALHHAIETNVSPRKGGGIRFAIPPYALSRQSRCEAMVAKLGAQKKRSARVRRLVIASVSEAIQGGL